MAKKEQGLLTERLRTIVKEKSLEKEIKEEMKFLLEDIDMHFSLVKKKIKAKVDSEE
jgi:hypothetical protein